MLDRPPIVREALRFRRALERPEDLVATFRSAAVYLECVSEPPTVPVVQVDDVPWLPVFSDLRFLAEYRLQRGEAGEVEYLLLAGARLLDSYLPGMPQGTSVLLDPAQAHSVALPALHGITPASVAVDRDQPERPVAAMSPYERPVVRAWGGTL
ncbi:hypothetical protein SAMN05421805_10123 [Saccharopolyspora antimicrobica]|uniref:SseB protein N-terminal domain-containing protein n=1 Tax=Saccharopolyspora antimicrobica TaxID=455193 RepID=A0A1I4QAS9_9PSEU|nr:SseB family protein [Saccharopolyspora antimicrobica]RKT84833.1 hypothetical protein ATL45_3161 [Saccharopolyspora antimicrobica]SFM36720.1 hypothetical protein SAMN05421805_10123 [Saccharopolyspora antimicrobica]